MIPRLDSLRRLGEETAGELLSWRPAHGVLSLYIQVDPGDRSGRWRTEVRSGLSAAGAGVKTADREANLALQATVDRLHKMLEEESSGGEPRALIGFVEVARKPGEERWYGARIAPGRPRVLFGRAAQIHPLLELLDDGAPLGVAAVSSERVRLLDWRLGQAEQLHDWELEYFAGQWRERKGPRTRDPARGQAVSSSGRDQHDQRLEANRERFAKQTGELARGEAKGRGWRQLLVFGDERYAREFAEGLDDRDALRHVEGADLISEPIAKIEGRIEQLLPDLNRERERLLIDRIKEAAYAEGRSALGPQETFQALGEGRVEHLVYDSERDYPDELEMEGEAAANGLPLIERMIELALSTSAAITPVEGESAKALDEQGGVIALLRY